MSIENEGVAGRRSTQSAGAKSPSKPRVGAGVRSPNYPVTDFPDAVERLKKVFGTIRTRPNSYEVIAQSMGYKGLNGASRTMMSTLRKFGLLEEVGREGLQLTGDGKALVMLPNNDPQYVAAAGRCALRPVAFADLYATYGVNPPGADSLKFVLVGRGFTTEAATEVIKNYRRTIDFLQQTPGALDTSAENLDEDGTDEQSPPPNDMEDEEDAPSLKPRADTFFSSGIPDGMKVGLPTRELSVTLPNNSRAYVVFQGTATDRVILRLKAYLDVFTEDLLEDVTASPAHQVLANSEKAGGGVQRRDKTAGNRRGSEMTVNSHEGEQDDQIEDEANLFADDEDDEDAGEDNED